MATSSKQIRSLEDIETVVDCDFHMTEEEEDFLPYLEDPFDKLLNLDTEQPSVGKGLYANAGYLTPMKTGKQESPLVRTVEDVREAMELLHLDKVFITPGTNLRLSYLHHDELAGGLATAYNSWLLDTVLDEDPNMYGAILVAPQKPDIAAEEIERRADEDKMVAVALPGAGTIPPLGNDQYFPIYEAAENAGLPIAIHCGATGFMSSFPFQYRFTKRYLDVHMLTHPLEMMSHLTTMLTNGIPVRYPGLEFIIQETGIGWIPYFMERYDNEYSEKQYDAPLIDQTPSNYLNDRFYFTTQPIEGADNPKYLKYMIELVDGEQNLLFASDYPHFDFDFTDTFLKAIRSQLGTDVIEKVYGGTAQDVLGI